MEANIDYKSRHRSFEDADLFLDAKYTAERKKGGVMLRYIEGWAVIDSLNTIIGRGNWSFEIKNHVHPFVDPINPADSTKKTGVSIASECVGRLTVKTEKGLSVFEDVGYGSGISYQEINRRGDALEQAGKEAVTDALKRCAKNLGNQFGLCLYDKSLSSVFEVSYLGYNRLKAQIAKEVPSIIQSVKEIQSRHFLAAYGTEWTENKASEAKESEFWKNLMREVWVEYYVNS